MKVEKVLLINCTLDKHSRAKIHNVVSSPNLGLLSIAGVLIMHGYDVKILDFFADPIKKEQYKKILEEFNPDVIGYSVYTRTVPFLRRMVELNKKIGYGFKWNQLGELYQWFTNTYANLSLKELMGMLDDNIQKIFTMIDSMTEEELFLPHKRKWADEATKTAVWEVYKFIHVNTVAPFGTFRTKIRKWKKLLL